MRPCDHCGCPIANDLLHCETCATTASKQEEPEAFTNSTAQNKNNEDRTDIHRFLWWAFGILVVALPALGYILGGAVVALMFGFLGFMIFAMLEKFTH